MDAIPRKVKENGDGDRELWD